jgi:hypothetical protein
MHPLWPRRRPWSRCGCLPLGLLLPASGNSVACESVKCLHSVSFSPGSLLAWKATGIYRHGQLARAARVCANAALHNDSRALRPYCGPASLDLLFLTPQTQFMAHTYLLFDFATDEEKAQLARHKLETWKQAFRLDKKLLYKFDRAASGDGAEPSVELEPAKPAKEAKAKGVANSKSKSKAKSEDAESDTPATTEASPPEPVKLLIRLDFSSHEKLSGQRWVDRIPTEDPFQAASPKVIKPNDTEFADTEKQFEDLA